MKIDIEKHALKHGLPDGFEPMATAPRDGTEIDILFRHVTWHYADTETRDSEWQQVCKARWTDFNGGGWVWYGICGVAIGWRMPTIQ